MRNKSVLSILSIVLLTTVFSSSTVSPDSDDENINENKDFIFSSQICSEWANNSNIELDSILFGGYGYNEILAPDHINQTDFEFIESEQDFLDLLLISGDRIVSGSKIYFPHDIRIDLSGKYGIVIEDNVILVGPRGIQGKIGTTFFTTSFAETADYASQKPLFSVIGNNVMISGLVFEGPVPVGDEGNFDWKKGRFGIEVNHTSELRESYVKISNNEMYGFGHASLSIEKTFTFDIRNSNVLIEHNFIHDNMQFQSGISGTGYGIVINDAYPLIRYNEFGLNRHDVAHTGYFHSANSDFLSGYEFAYNLLHLGATDHLVDVHCYGKENSTNCEDYAGDFVYIHNNLFYDPQVALAIRGAPTVGGCIHDNEFVVSESLFLERKTSLGLLGEVFAFENLFNQENKMEWADADGDGIGDRSDSDDDNDGVTDFYDAFPLNASESIDTDLDGIGNNADTDDDGDGFEDIIDIFPLDELEWNDVNADGFGDNEYPLNSFNQPKESLAIPLLSIISIFVFVVLKYRAQSLLQPKEKNLQIILEEDDFN